MVWNPVAQLSPAGRAAGWAPGQMCWQAGGSQASSSCAPAAGGPSCTWDCSSPGLCAWDWQLQSVVERGNSLKVSLSLLKQCKSWRFWGFCFAGGGRRLFRCKGSNWSSVTMFLFIFCHAKMRTVWWRCFKIYTKTNACSCIYSSPLDTGGNSSCSSLKVIVPSLSDNKILIRVTGIILIYPCHSAKACITLQAYCQILASAKDAVGLWSWSFLVLEVNEMIKMHKQHLTLIAWNTVLLRVKQKRNSLLETPCL